MFAWIAGLIYHRFALPLSLRRPPYKVIGPAQDPYLHRWYLTPWREAYESIPKADRTRWQRFVSRLPNVYLHCFFRGDDDRALHDHPWDWASYLIHGTYAEVTHEPLQVTGIRMHGADAAVVDVEPRRLVVTRYFSAGSIRGHRAEFAHRLTLNVGARAWTLFFCGWRRREWGFHCPKGWVHWTDFTDPATQGATVGKGCGE